MKVLKQLVFGGADAIYMGLSKFNAREMAENFNIEKYIECIEYAHYRGIKVYLTINTLMNDNELEEALDLVIELYSKGLDAVIIQDLGFAYLLHKVLPDLPMHASTQMSVYSLEQVKFLEELGFKRVVLARELSVTEIENICNNTNVEIEVFVHGALCVSMSGQCLLSSVIGNRSANRGACAQPCRMKYSLYNNKDKEVIKQSYLLSKKDIYGLEYINKLKNIGVTSLKIEGRNKTPEYVLGVTKIYRKYLNKELKTKNIDNIDKFTLKQIFNRDGLSEGYLNGVRYIDSISLNSPKNTGIYIGDVVSTYKKYIKVRLKEDIALHDGVEIYSNNNVISNIVTCIKDENGNILNKKVLKGEYVFLGDFKEKVEVGSKVYRTTSSKLNKELKEEYVSNNRRKNYNIVIDILKGKKLTVIIKSEDLVINFDHVPEEAKNKSLTSEDIINVFEKTLDEPFKFVDMEINLDDNLFIPVSKLNEFRRLVISKLKDRYIVNMDKERLLKQKEQAFKDLQKDILGVKNKNKEEIKYNSLFVYRYDQNKDYIKDYDNTYNKKLDVIYFNIADFSKYNSDIILKYRNRVNIYLYIPNYVGNNLDKIIKENIEEYLKLGIKGILLGSFSYFKLLNSLKSKYEFNLVADYTFNATNMVSMYFLNSIGFDRITPSVEINKEAYLNMSKYFSIEIVNDIITAMTSRYCILGSFVGNKGTDKKCEHPCKQQYYIKDTHGAKYYILCDDIDCIMRILKYRKREEYNSLAVNVRRCTLT